MFLDKLSLSDFRNYKDTKIDFSDEVNLVYGLNAQGKTNLLEAIYLSCLGRSFRGAKNQELLKTHASSFTIEAALRQDNDLTKNVVIHYIRNGKKEISVNRKRLQSNSRIFGRFPVVVMSPEDYKITSGGPSERRRFLDILLSQVSISYLTSLQEFTRILKQRNKILQSIREGVRVSHSTLEPWTHSLIRSGTQIILKRIEFLQEFLQHLKPIYQEYSLSKDHLEMSLESVSAAPDSVTIDAEFNLAVQRVNEKEKKLGLTLIGPHRDDIAIRINGKDLRKFGSRGEHKSVLIAMKIAEFNYLNTKKEETPIFLLDDYYSELDDLREKKVFASLYDLGQIFLTSPKEKIFREHPEVIKKIGAVSTYRIENGTIHACT